jgi:nucleoside-diphosphate-sugar epimerase
VAADVRTSDLHRVFAGADAVVHLAWAFQPTHDPVVTWEVNVRGSERVLEAVRGAGVPTLVHLSSIGTYRSHPGDEPVDESWPTDALPTAAYGREKSYVERLLDAVEPEVPDTRIVRLRPCFLFARGAAEEQRRIFAGPFVPGALLRLPLPVVPLPAELRFQAMHADDAAEAVRLALHRPVRGPFNLAAGPVIDGPTLAKMLGGRAVPVPRAAVRAALAAAWHARLVPASPDLLELFLGLPLLDPGRAHRELGWSPRRSGIEALEELLAGIRHGGSTPTPPLAGSGPGSPDSAGAAVGDRLGGG